MDNTLMNTLVILKDGSTMYNKVNITLKLLRDVIGKEMLQLASIHGYEFPGNPFPNVQHGVARSLTAQGSGVMRFDRSLPHFPAKWSRGQCIVHKQVKKCNTICEVCKKRMCWDICFKRYHTIDDYEFDDRTKSKLRVKLLTDRNRRNIGCKSVAFLVQT